MPILYLEGTVTRPHQAPRGRNPRTHAGSAAQGRCTALLSAQRIERRHFDFHIPVFRKSAQQLTSESRICPSAPMRARWSITTGVSGIFRAHAIDGREEHPGRSTDTSPNSSSRPSPTSRSCPACRAKSARIAAGHDSKAAHPCRASPSISLPGRARVVHNSDSGKHSGLPHAIEHVGVVKPIEAHLNENDRGSLRRAWSGRIDPPA